MRAPSVVAPAVLAAVTLVLGGGPPRSAPAGPAAVLEMHRELFTAMDAGDAEAAVGFLAPDARMEQEHGARPCTLFLEGESGPRAAYDHALARTLLETWVRTTAAQGRWKTAIDWARSDCPSGDLGYAVIEFRRTRARAAGDTEGTPEVRRYRGTSLATWDDGRWRLHHWQVAELGPTRR